MDLKCLHRAWSPTHLLSPLEVRIARVARTGCLVITATAVVALAGCASALHDPPPSHPASSRGASGPDTPPFTTLAGNAYPGTDSTTPSVAPAASGAASTESPAGSGSSSPMPDMHHHDHGAETHAETSASEAPIADMDDMPGMAGMHHHDHASAPNEPAASPAPRTVSSTDDEHAAYEHARPVFEHYCAACHTTRGARHSAAGMNHFAMDGYPFGGHHAAMAGDAVREALGQSGSPASMPLDRPGAVQGADLAAVIAWADAFNRAHGQSGGAAHDDHGDAHDHAHPAGGDHAHHQHANPKNSIDGPLAGVRR